MYYILNFYIIIFFNFVVKINSKIVKPNDSANWED
jgi:hypothetical protein